MDPWESPSFAPTPAVLLGLPVAGSRFGLPASYTQAQELFARAEQAYGAGQAEAAAEQFVQVASLLRVAQPTTYAAQFGHMREIAYRNAVLCFAAAGQPAQARQALTAARAVDVDNGAVIDGLLAALD